MEFKQFKDNKGRHYIHFDGNKSKCVLAYEGVNKEFAGFPQMVLRIGESKFGDELIFEFKIKELLKEYPINSDHECIEFYLPLNEALINALFSLGFIGKDVLRRVKENE